MSVQKKVVYGYCINHPCTRKAKSLLFGTVAYAFGMRVVAKHSNKQSPTFFFLLADYERLWFVKKKEED